MKHALKLISLAATLLALNAGCDPFDYYPQHEAHLSDADMDKAGQSVSYGGTDGKEQFPQPKGRNTTNPGSSSKPVDTKPAVSFGLGGSTAFDEAQTGSYGGSNVGGGTSGYIPNRPADDGRVFSVAPAR
jgi:hypothetical protein